MIDFKALDDMKRVIDEHLANLPNGIDYIQEETYMPAGVTVDGLDAEGLRVLYVGPEVIERLALGSVPPSRLCGIPVRRAVPPDG